MGGRRRMNPEKSAFNTGRLPLPTGDHVAHAPPVLPMPGNTLPLSAHRTKTPSKWHCCWAQWPAGGAGG